MPSLPYSIEALVLGVKRQVTSLETGDAIIPDVVVSEMHEDEVVVTEHPVDFGANIADHAYVKPATVVCTFGWSDSSMLINSVLSGSILRGVAQISDVYEAFLTLMRKRVPLSLSTGKRSYDCVIITKVREVTNVDTEAALKLEVHFREVIRTFAQVVSLSQVKNPAKYSGVNKRGNIGYNTTAVGTGG